MCASPYAAARQAYANPLVLTASEAAFAAICAALGLTVASNADAKALFADWELYTEDIDALAAQVSALQDAAIEAGAANGSLVNVTKQQVSQAEIDAINAMLDAAGKAGSLALDQLSMMCDVGKLSVLPFLLRSFIDHTLHANDVIVPGSIVLGGMTVPVCVSSQDLFLGYSVPSYTIQQGFKTASVLYRAPSGDYFCTASYPVRPNYESPAVRVYVNLDGTYQVGSYYGHRLKLVNGRWDITSYGNHSYTSVSDLSGYVFADHVRIEVYLQESAMNLLQGTYDCSTGVWTGNDNVWTDNPDVNLGHDWWTDARDMVDVLNPAMGAAVIGADAVIDGDYIVNRGSIAIPTDWSGINTWADALGATQSGVVQGALDGVISGATTGTAVNVGTGELVTDTVGNLVKPNAGTSVSPTTPKFDWGKFLDPSLYLVFPFCLPWDLVELVKTLSAEPQAPVIEWPMPALSGTQTLRVDLSPWSPVAAVLRAGELIVAAVGLVWVTKTMIRN